MVLINLSSNGELDPAKFSNYFSQGLTIEKNSFICLVSASIVEDLANNIITIPALTPLTVRFDPLNQVTKILNTIETEYTLTSLSAHINTLFLNLHNAIGFNTRVTIDPQNNNLGIIHFQFFNRSLGTLWAGQQSLWGINPAFQTAIDNDTYETQQYYNWITKASVGTLPNWTLANVTENSNNLLTINFPSGPAPDGVDSFCAISGNPTYTLNGINYDFSMTNNPNKESCNLLLQNPITEPSANIDYKNYNFTQFTIASNANKIGQSATSIYTAAIGPAVHNAGTGEYSQLPIPSLDGDAFIFHIDFVGNGKTLLTQIDITDGTPVESELNPYSFGDVYRIGFSKTTDAAPNPVQSNCPNIITASYDGLVFWLPLSQTYTGAGSTALIFGTRVIEYNPGINFLYKSIASQNQPLALWDTHWLSSPTELRANGGYMGCWGGAGFQNSVRAVNPKPMFVDAGQNNNMNTQRLLGKTYSDFVEDVPLFFRCDIFTPEPPTNQSTFKQRLQLNLDQGKLLTEYPTAISFLFRFYDDSGIITAPAQHTMTPLGGIYSIGATEDSVFQIHLLQSQVMDVTIFDDTGNPFPIILNDADATRISIEYGKYYQFLYLDEGEGNFLVTIIDIEDNYKRYTHGPTTLTSKRLMNPNCIGGINQGITSDAQNYMSGNIADFRMYSKPRTGSQTVIGLWNDLITGFAGYGVSENAWDPIMTAMPTITSVRPAPNQQSRFFNIPDTNIENTNSVCFSTKGLQNDSFSVNPAFTDVYVPLDINIDHANSTKDLPLKALTGYGNGLTELAKFHGEVEFEDYDGINERVIDTYVNTTATGANNPFFDENANVSNISLQDEVFNVEIPNLPHITYNGTNKTTDKTIYQLPVETTSRTIHNVKITEHSPASKVWIPLRNAGEIPINKLDVQISKENGQKATGLQQDTHVSIQIEKREDIFN